MPELEPDATSAVAVVVGFLQIEASDVNPVTVKRLPSRRIHLSSCANPSRSCSWWAASFLRTGSWPACRQALYRLAAGALPAHRNIGCSAALSRIQVL